jgi:thiol-disulfide isomerase/thioredoxin
MKKSNHTSSNKILVMSLIGLGLIALGGLGLTYLLRSDVGAEGLSEEYKTVIPAEVNFHAPELDLTDLEGNPVSLADYSGQVVLINNWAFWCTPCRAELPVLERYYMEYKDQDFVIIGIDAGNDIEDVVYHVELYKLTYPIWMDPKTESLRAFRNNVLPSSYVIDADGQVRLAWTGPISWEMLEQYVTPLLEQ